MMTHNEAIEELLKLREDAPLYQFAIAHAIDAIVALSRIETAALDVNLSPLMQRIHTLHYVAGKPASDYYAGHTP